MNMCSAHLKMLLVLLLVSFPIVLSANDTKTTLNVCIDGENNRNRSETRFWTDFATTFNISYESRFVNSVDILYLNIVLLRNQTISVHTS